MKNKPKLSTLMCIGVISSLLFNSAFMQETNRALRKAASMSSELWSADLAVDGDTTTNSSNCHCCAATNEENNPWLRVDLGRKYRVKRVVIRGRTDDGGITLHDMNGMQIYLHLNETIPTSAVDDITSVTSVRYHSLTATVPIIARYVTLLLGLYKQLMICELEVYTKDCISGTYGVMCEQACGHCFNNEPCDHVDGHCNKCSAGFIGTKCQEDCADGYFGINCKGVCHCQNNVPCDRITGRCPGNICDHRWTGNNCSINRNVALGKSVLMSSVQSPALQAGHAVDGILRGKMDAYLCNCCAATGEQVDPWIHVDLGGIFKIFAVTVYGLDKYGEKPDSVLTILSFHYNKSDLGNLTKFINTNTHSEVVLQPFILARFLTFSREDHSQLGFCEIQVYGECQPGTFGPDCRPCYCDGPPCDVWNGACPSGKCLSGYTGDSCDQACPDGTYGFDCQDTCHCESSTCDNVFGWCPGQEECPGRPGDECIKSTKNMALNKAVVISLAFPDANFKASHAVDGKLLGSLDSGTCYCCAATGTMWNPWIRVDLGGVFRIFTLVVYGRTGLRESFNNMNIYLHKSEADKGNAVRIYKTSNTFINETFYPVIPARYVTLQQMGNLLTVYCEVEVYVECTAGTFGPECRPCHCDGPPCDFRNGVCPSGKCLPGYTGPRCDQGDPINLALGKEVQLSSPNPLLNYNARHAVDGKLLDNKNPDTCLCCAATSTQQDPWLQLDLGVVYMVSTVVVYGAKDILNETNIYLHESKTARGDVSRQVIADVAYFNEVLDPSVPARYVTILRKGIDRAIFCEVEVHGECPQGKFAPDCRFCHCDGPPCDVWSGVCPSGKCLPGYIGPKCDRDINVAYQQKVIMSSVQSWTDWGPNNAVDGIVPASEFGDCGCCSSTKMQINPWIRVDLGDIYRIFAILIYFNEPVGGDSTIYVNLQTIIEIFDEALIRVNTDIETFNQTFTHPVLAQYVTVVEEGFSQLSICELKAMTGVCGNGTYGPTCEHVCHCAGPTCDTDTGYCPSGICQPGYTGFSCDKVCPNGTYGENCTMRCGACLHDVPCDHVDGTCRQCKEGYTGNVCSEVCGNGTYGPTCDHVCHCEGPTCDTQTGYCPSGTCQPGYTGLTCAKVCSNGTYGENCTMRCGACLHDLPCDHVDGTCRQCKEGYTRKTCTEVCGNGTYGPTCEHACHCAGPTCDTQTGYCPSGICQPGYTGLTCETVCPNGTYGENCTMRCGACLHDLPCDHVDGTCRQCKEGYTGNVCSEALQRINVAVIVSSIIGPLCLIAIVVVIAVLLRKRYCAEDNYENYTMEEKASDSNPVYTTI